MKYSETGLWEQKNLATIAAFSATELATLKTMLEKKLNSPLTSSAGRLFDAVASLVNLRQQIRFEGQAAMELEFALEGIETDEAYPIADCRHADEQQALQCTHHQNPDIGNDSGLVSDG